MARIVQRGPCWPAVALAFLVGFACGRPGVLSAVWAELAGGQSQTRPGPTAPAPNRTEPDNPFRLMRGVR